MDSSLHSIVAAQLIQDRIGEATHARQARVAGPARPPRRRRALLRRLLHRIPEAPSAQPEVVQ